jgi:DNA-binding CsgD family transcriptional regulator
VTDDVHEGSPRWHAPQPAEAILRTARDVLRVVATLTGETEAGRVRDLAAAESALRAAEHAVLHRLGQGDGAAAAQLAAALPQLGATLSAIRDLRLEARAATLTGVQHALGRLRSATSLRELTERIPVEINRLGYQRALLSRLSGPQWSARAAFAHDDPQLARDLVEVGSTLPGQIGRELPETEVVRKRLPVLVEDAQHNPRVHHRLINLARTKDYVVAPLVGRGEVVGLLHADQHVERPSVDDFDQRLIGLFAEGVGCVFERVVFLEQLGTLREQLREQTRSVGDLIDGFLGADAFTEAPVRAADPLARLDGPFADLTRRELDVLRHLVRGRTNSEIAAELYVSPGTVKTHVKNVLRKLGVANRAEATSRYHALTRQ